MTVKRDTKRRLKVIDATCPFVKKIQRYVKELCRDGYKVAIVGKAEHPEVKGLIDFTEGKAVVIKDAKAAEALKVKGSRLGVVSQSTYSLATFLQIVSILLKKDFSELRVFNTICKDTMRRQEAAARLANSCDVMIVVGGKNSSNTRRLVEACKEIKRGTYHIEESSDIDPAWFNQIGSAGIASGASTPDWVIKGVIDKIRRYAKDGSKR